MSPLPLPDTYCLAGPYNSPVDETANVNVLPAGFLAAVEWLNANISNLLPASGGCGANVTVVPFILDSSRIGDDSKTRALRHADQLYKCPDAGGGGGGGSCSAEASIGRNVDAIIADQYSSTATTIAMMAEIHQKPMVGYGSTSDALSNKKDYPYYNRVVAPDRYQAPYLAAMVHSFGWRHIGVLNGQGSYAAGFAGAFAAKCATFDDPILIEERHVFTEGDRDSATMDALLATIDAAGVKIIMLASAGYADTIFVLERANALGMTGDGYVWIGADGWMSADDFKDIQGSDGRTEANQLKEYTHGSVGIFHYTDTPNPTAAVGTSARMASIAEDYMYGAAGTLAWQTEAARQDPTWRIPDFAAPYDVWGLYVWDAAVHTARAAALADENCFRNGSCLQAAIRNHTTIGTTGTVKLNRTTGDRALGAYVILNIQKDDPKILVPVGTINAGVVDIWGVDSIVWPNGATGLAGVPSDGDWSASSKTEIDTDLAIGLGLGFGIPILLLLGFLYFYRKQKIKRSREKKAMIAVAVKEKDALQKQLTDLQESMQAMMEVHTPWAGITDIALANTASASRTVDGASRSSIKLSVKPAAPKKHAAPAFTVTWYWGEDKHSLHKHNPYMIKAPNWVQYSGSVQAELNQAYDSWKAGTGTVDHNTDLADRISTTGNEQKANNAHTGTKYKINFARMEQKNSHSGFARKILRLLFRDVTQNSDRDYLDLGIESDDSDEGPTSRPITVLTTAGVSQGAPPAPKGVSTRPSTPKIAAAKKRICHWDSREVRDLSIVGLSASCAGSYGAITVAPGTDVASDDGDPIDWSVEDTLPLRKGQLIQVHKKRADGYWHGSIIYDKDDADNDHAGWFPGVNLTKASAKLTAAFQARIGGAGADALAVPTSWDDQPDKLHAQAFDVPLGSTEAKGKIAEFMRTLGSAPPTVVSLHRVQNIAMWQSYAVKKITMMNRVGARRNWEKPTLFHGTDEDTANKIMQQGFNRNFSGLNATYYGKGVYFARDASYSSSKAYARPNAAGVQRMFLCRVLAGEYCRGQKDVKAPDVLDAATNRLYDTTVDNMSSPGIFVTYHDAQVYPEYLIQFKQR